VAEAAIVNRIMLHLMFGYSNAFMGKYEVSYGGPETMMPDAVQLDMDWLFVTEREQARN
jgi:hypothetical protein